MAGKIVVGVITAIIAAIVIGSVKALRSKFRRRGQADATGSRALADLYNPLRRLWMHVAWLEASLQEAEKNRLHAAGQTDHLRSAANVFEETWRRLEPEIPRDVRESFVFPDWGTAKENWIKWYGVSVGGDRYDRKWYEIAQEMKQTLDPLKDALGRVDPRVATWVPTHYPDSAS